MSQINLSGNATVRTALASKTPRDVAAYARGQKRLYYRQTQKIIAARDSLGRQSKMRGSLPRIVPRTAS